MIQGELTLVRILGFNVDVELPHVWIASILYGMAWWEQGGVPAKDTELVDDQIKYVARLAWKIANRVVSAGLVDREPVQALAATCVLLSLEADGVPLPAKNLSEWTSAWARSPLSQVERTRRLVEERVDIALCRQERDADNSHHHLNKHGWSSDLQ
ncbi:hypothetical protein GGI04_003439 [Coemansia thaxteri]|uniref:Uncharacterized protein n=1 Tax=Coemansia thaxteri TaxID=2663907 RepID=A0A9W8BI18_9FUNG|nr:hypothetical protein GGI04_003439 [Coemansia thaxteri]KAJ2007477.1 hypothetical protein H4R26_000739 [Coemansia thaxteri]KAJ2470137.1 hypothetical protein GGI02_003128 [Coemansia sp. RSA 2322]KAJ2487021.1 hypothetical protein EV174_000760 [Coemansia sp. RSA 2320]